MNIQELPLLATSSLVETIPVAGKSWLASQGCSRGRGEMQGQVTLIKSVERGRVGRRNANN